MYFEDFEPGQVFHTGTRTLTEADIIAFAKDWDPQYFHLDAEAAKASLFRGLVASGFHTLLTTFRLIIETGLWRDASMGSPGFEKLRWRLPVRPGDTLRVEMEVLDKRLSGSRGDRGYITWAMRTFNQDEALVMDYTSSLIAATRPVDR